MSEQPSNHEVAIFHQMSRRVHLLVWLSALNLALMVCFLIGLLLAVRQ